MTKDIARLKKITLYLLLVAVLVFTAWLIWMSRLFWIFLWVFAGGGL